MIRAFWKKGRWLLGAFLILAASDPARAASTEAGMAKSAPCVGCHGADAFNADLSSPTLAGQREAYLARQLRAFREKGRIDPVMNKIAAGLSDADIEDLAAYYASLAPLKGRKRKPNARLAAEGKKKYPACGSCHGPRGAGQGDLPRLTGQQPIYLSRQLKAFQEGRRPHPGIGDLIGKLNERDIRALAEYLSSLE